MAVLWTKSPDSVRGGAGSTPALGVVEKGRQTLLDSMKAPTFTATQTLLATSLVLIVGVMACPNPNWDADNPLRELERMHAQVVDEPEAETRTSEVALNVLVRAPDGAPAAGVPIRILDTQRKSVAGIWNPSSKHSALYEGVTGPNGRCIDSIQLPQSLSQFAIEWRAPRAPTLAARTIVERSELSQLELSLARP